MSIWRPSKSWPVTPHEATVHLASVQMRLRAALDDPAIPEERVRDLTILRDAWREHVTRLYAPTQ